MKEVEVFIVCSCQTEGLYIKRHKNEKEVYFSIFSRGINPKRFNLKDKIRYIIQCFKGKPFEDEIILCKKDLLKLKKIIDKLV